MTLYEITYGRVGRHGSRREGSPPAPAPYRLRAADVDELMREVLADVRHYLGSRFLEVALNMEEMRGIVLAGDREAGSFTIAVVDEPEAVGWVEQVEAEVLATELPSATKVGLRYLARFASEDVRVFRDSGKTGNGVSRPALERLLRDGLVELGKFEASRGKLIRVTALGRAVLTAHQAGAQ